MIHQPALKRLLGWSALLAALHGTTESLLARDKTDVVILTNGDRVTGEIKELARGKLRLSTDLMGTVEIEWEGIQQLSSDYRFEVEKDTGERHFGSIRSGSDRDIQVAGEQASVEMDHMSVVRIHPIETGLSRLEGFLDVGFSFTRANRVAQWTLGAEVRSRTPKRQVKGTLSSLLSDQQDLERSTRNVLGLSFDRFFGDRWFAAALAQFTQNEELELDLRSIVGGGLGRHFIQTNRRELSLLGGLLFNRERFTGPLPVRSNAEAFVGLLYSAFQFKDPETDISLSLFLYPSLSTAGRYRLDLETRIRYEIFKDFFWGISLFDNFDSDPPLLGAERNDFGISTSFGWEF